MELISGLIGMLASLYILFWSANQIGTDGATTFLAFMAIMMVIFFVILSFSAFQARRVSRRRKK